MDTKKILTPIFILSIVFTILGSLMKIMHTYSADNFLKYGVILGFVFAAIALYEIWNSTKIYKNEKFMWTIGLIFLGTLTGIIYLVSGRKRIVNN